MGRRARSGPVADGSRSRLTALAHNSHPPLQNPHSGAIHKPSRSCPSYYVRAAGAARSAATRLLDILRARSAAAVQPAHPSHSVLPSRAAVVPHLTQSPAAARSARRRVSATATPVPAGETGPQPVRRRARPALNTEPGRRPSGATLTASFARPLLRRGPRRALVLKGRRARSTPGLVRDHLPGMRGLEAVRPDIALRLLDARDQPGRAGPHTAIDAPALAPSSGPCRIS